MKTLLALLSATALFGIKAAVAASTWDGVYTDAQAERGREQYLQHCSICHSVSLQGNNEAPPLVGRFIPDWADAPLADLYEYTSSAMPLDRPGSLSAAAYADIVAYLLKANGLPSGQNELESGTLGSIHFDIAAPLMRARSNTGKH